jgi:hypothetical protein
LNSVGRGEITSRREKLGRKAVGRTVRDGRQRIAIDCFEREHLVLAGTQLRKAELAIGTRAYLRQRFPAGEAVAYLTAIELHLRVVGGFGTGEFHLSNDQALGRKCQGYILHAADDRVALQAEICQEARFPGLQSDWRVDWRAAASELLLRFQNGQFEVSMIVGKRRRTFVGGVHQRASDGLLRHAVDYRTADRIGGLAVRRLGLGIGFQPAQDAQDGSDCD